MNRNEPTPATHGMTVAAFKKAFLDNLYYKQGQDRPFATPQDYYATLAYTVRDALVDRWRVSREAVNSANPRTVYYLSAEYLPGRQLANNLLVTGLAGVAQEALTELGIDIDAVLACEAEPGLGNGGLGRLAACYLDSLATLDIPAVGYGIRYEFGIFRQTFQDGWQVEQPDNWLFFGNPWEFIQPDDMVEVGFGGHTETVPNADGTFDVRWVPSYTVLGIPYHVLVPGYGTETVNTLRLWAARASDEFDLQLFNTGDFVQAVHQKTRSENISKVLYPNDNTPQGRQLRLEQQYFFVACSLRDIVRQFLYHESDWDTFSDRVTIQLNDTHPTIGIAELMRILLDEQGLTWERAWQITTRTFAYTNHTLLPEALEVWPVSLLSRLVPRHLEIIYEINFRFLQDVEERFPGDDERVRRLSIIKEGHEKMVRMANLACVASYAVNGVAPLQSQLLRERVLSDFAEMYPEKFTNVTNGVTPRRFIQLANPPLARLITDLIGDGWLTNLDDLRGLEPYADDATVRQQWHAVKQQNKQALAAIIAQQGVTVDPDSLFVVMAKRLHEYKRQLLKVLHIITLYHRIKDGHAEGLVPQTFIFGAKAAPGYWMAKLIIKLINNVGAVVNNDPGVRDLLKVSFLPNFNVSLAQQMYPAANLSQQISLAGKEASGTGNMKFALNGAITIGTLDGANVEIRDLVGADNFFLFGLTTEQVYALKDTGYNPTDYYESNPQLKRVINSIATGEFSGGDREIFRPIVESLLYHDEYMSLADYQAYIECEDTVLAAYRDRERWTRMSLLNAARCGYFSSDRSIRDYCTTIWNVEPVKPSR